MTVQELIDKLEALKAQHGSDMQVKWYGYPAGHEDDPTPFWDPYVWFHTKGDHTDDEDYIAIGLD